MDKEELMDYLVKHLDEYFSMHMFFACFIADVIRKDERMETQFLNALF